MRTAARADANQPAIVAALRAAGYYVVNIRWPVDLLVGTPGGWLPMEIKDGSKPPSARALTADQQEFIRCAGSCPVAVVTDPDGAVRAARAMG